ncbi:MAG TPA: hypothetical protein DCK95_11965 [Anaerolineaceae bacterium]|nr:hypothetical protein [Anaerolineaceae bacterium]
MNIHGFLKYQFNHFILRRRWILPIPVGLCLGYWAQKVIQSAVSSYAPASQGNALEAFIWAFGKPEIVYFVVSVLWIFLISDLTPEGSFGQQIILRLGSRSTWWMGKVLFVLLSTFAYALVLMTSFFIPVLSKYPFSETWSTASLNSSGINLGYSTMNSSPLQAFWNILLFLLIGWFAIGLLVQIINLIFKQRWAGFLSGIIIIICSMLGAIDGGPIGGNGITSFFLLQNHLEFTPLWVPERVIPEIYSWIFWAVWVLVCLVTGFIISRRTNFYAVKQEEG